MLRWWKTNERRVVLAVRPVDERTVQIIRKGPFLVECAVVVDGEAVAVFGAGPAWLQASGRAANKASTGWPQRSLRGLLKLAPQGRLMARGRPSAEAADEASVEGSFNLGLGIARVAATARRSRGQRPQTCQNQAE